MVSPSPSRAGAGSRADALIIGDGIIGLSIAYALADAGAECTMIGRSNDGTASFAAAGLLMPSLASLAPDVQPFFAVSLAAYPAFVERLRRFDPELHLVEGLYELDSGAGDSPRFHPRDASIDNVRLVRALRAAVASAGVKIVADDPVISIDAKPAGGAAAAVVTRGGQRLSATAIVLAAGAWAPQIAGLPRPLPVRPLKGQMLALGSSAINNPIVGDDVYLVPRIGEILAGATVEEAGFDTSVDRAAIEALRRAAVELVPSLAGTPVIRTWAGIRPATPDMLPILGRDPDAPSLIYACGHSKNGILLAPATASATARLIGGGSTATELRPFSIARFR